MKVRFLKSPIGSHSLGYFAGEVANLGDDLARELIKEGIAEEVKADKPKRGRPRTAESKEAKKSIKR